MSRGLGLVFPAVVHARERVLRWTRAMDLLSRGHEPPLLDVAGVQEVLLSPCVLPTQTSRAVRRPRGRHWARSWLLTPARGLGPADTLL